LQDAKGTRTQLQLKLPVAVRAPAAALAPTDGRKH